MVAGFGDVGKGSAASLKNAGCRVARVRNRSDLRAAGGDGRHEVTTMEDAASRADIFVTATGNVDVITLDHMRKMEDRAIVCYIGHFDSEIQVARPENSSGRTSSRRSTRSNWRRTSGSSSCRKALVNLGNAMGHPSFVMYASFTNQTLAQIELWTKPAITRRSLHAAQASRREGGLAASRTDRREALTS